jgi:hypothetical protein
MKRFTVYFIFALSAMLLWMTAGCSSTEEPNVDDDLMTRDQTVDPNDPYGGLNFADEAPAFGDPAMVEMFGPEEGAGYSDPVENDPAVVRSRERRIPVTYLMITWGNLEADTTIQFRTDWTGSLSARNGAVCLKRVIAWDNRDEILPRTSRDLLEWNSSTGPRFDGILVALHKIAPGDTAGDTTSVDAAGAGPLVVTFDTGPLTVNINEEHLRDLHRVIRVDDAGNAVAFNTIDVQPGACPNGFMAGRWRPVEDRPGGVFRGKWINYNGVHTGYVRGHYGPTADGEHVFFGKWIRHDGRFQGLLVGYYGRHIEDPGGWYRGIWITRALRTGGYVHGIWNTRDEAPHPGGFFRGRWTKVCDTNVRPE